MSVWVELRSGFLQSRRLVWKSEMWTCTDYSETGFLGATMIPDLFYIFLLLDIRIIFPFPNSLALFHIALRLLSECCQLLL